MREILFRGKNISGEWAYGSLILEKNAFDEKLILTIISDIYGNETLVNSETVGQYTGLTDKNGKKVFEGDFVNYNGTIHKVVYENRFGNAYFGIVISDMDTWGFSPSAPASMMEVIGNIHDNPELLEESL